MIIGLTGGIGSGKSYVANLFEKEHVPVYYADIMAKKLMNENSKLIEEIKKSFGEESYLDGVVNRDYISKNIDYLKTQIGNPNGKDQPNKKYYDLINDCKNRDNVHIIGYTPFENYYANNIRKLSIGNEIIQKRKDI